MKNQSAVYYTLGIERAYIQEQIHCILLNLFLHFGHMMVFKNIQLVGYKL